VSRRVGDEAKGGIVKIVIKAICIEGPEGKQHDGVTWYEVFSDYFDRDAFPGVSGGKMRFEWREDDQILYVITEYESDRRLETDEEQRLIKYTSGQWSDGIGENFASEDDNPDPWHPGQVQRLEYH
jgi:hypothetical protein